MRNLPVISLTLSGLVFGGFGLVFLIYPELVGLAGLEIVGPGGRVEVRGFYGGLEIGIAVFFFMALSRPLWHLPALVVQCLTLGGIAFGRLLGLAIGGGVDLLQIALIVAEVSGLLLGLLGIHRLEPFSWESD